MAAPAAAEKVRAVAPFSSDEGAGAGPSVAGPEAGPSAVLDSLPGAGGDEVSLLGPAAAGPSDSLEGGAAGGEVGELSGVLPEGVG